MGTVVSPGTEVPLMILTYLVAAGAFVKGTMLGAGIAIAMSKRGMPMIGGRK